MRFLPVVLLLLPTSLLEALAGQADRWPMTEPLTHGTASSSNAQGFYVLRRPPRYDSPQQPAASEPLRGGASLRQWSDNFPSGTQPLTTRDQYYQTKPSASSSQRSQNAPAMARWKYPGSTDAWQMRNSGRNGQGRATERFEVRKTNDRSHRKPAESSKSSASAGWAAASAPTNSKPKNILVIDAGYTTGNVQDFLNSGWPMKKSNGNGWQMAASSGWQGANSNGWQAAASSDGWQASSDNGWQTSGNDEQVYTVKTASMDHAAGLEADTPPFFSGAGPSNGNGHTVPEKQVYIVKTISHRPAPSSPAMAPAWPSDEWSDAPAKWPSDGWNGAMDMPMAMQNGANGGIGQQILALLGQKQEFILKTLPSLLPSAQQSAPSDWPSGNGKASKENPWG
ncbi:uncharacterized protein LOC142572353 [Dermacentor variabilis]|uniref:uncharacterized protein LOC142572353 n=1 Tax=Dermacentor variabilis TaxID=34621 RepID=UPI003F5BFB3C